MADTSLKFFSGVRAAWQPLYAELRRMACAEFGQFEERQTASALVWRKNSAFAEVSAKRNCMVICFARAAECDTFSPAKIVQTSKNRYIHYYEVTSAANFPWFIQMIHQAYLLTGQDKPAARHKRAPAAFTGIDEYLALFPENVRAVLQTVRETIQAAAPHASEKIAWQMPTFYQNGNQIHFAAAKNHVGVYPGVEAIAHFDPRLKPYKHSKGAVQFPFSKPMPYELIGEIAAWCAGRASR